MITEFFVDVVFSIAQGFFDIMPGMIWDVNTTAWQYAKDFIAMICYLLPYDTIITIVTLYFGVTIFRIVVSFIKLILPFK